jgi:hypothetical protein
MSREQAALCQTVLDTILEYEDAHLFAEVSLYLHVITLSYLCFLVTDSL